MGLSGRSNRLISYAASNGVHRSSMWGGPAWGGCRDDLTGFHTTKHLSLFFHSVSSCYVDAIDRAEQRHPSQHPYEMHTLLQ